MPPKKDMHDDQMRDYVVAIVKGLKEVGEGIKDLKKNPLDDILATNEKVQEILSKLLILSEKKIKDGEPGKDGKSIIGGSIKADGSLVFEFSDGEPFNVGVVVGRDGKDAKFDESALIKRFLARIPKTDEETIIKKTLVRVPAPPTPPSIEEIIRKIKKGKELSYHDLKDLPDLVEQIRIHTRHLENGARTIMSPGPSALSGLLDVDLTGLQVGQFLKWNGTDWVPGTGGSGSSPLTTKGDLYGYSTDNARIPVGSNGQVLTADSTVALGLKWTTPSSGGFTELAATGSVNSSNVTFTFPSVPTYIIADGLWFKPLDNNGNTQWSNVSTTITMVNPPSFSIYGVA